MEYYNKGALVLKLSARTLEMPRTTTFQGTNMTAVDARSPFHPLFIHPRVIYSEQEVDIQNTNNHHPIQDKLTLLSPFTFEINVLYFNKVN